MKNDLNDLKKLTLDLMKNGTSESVQEKNQGLIDKIYGKDNENPQVDPSPALEPVSYTTKTPEIAKIEPVDKYAYAETIEEEEPLSLQE